MARFRITGLGTPFGSLQWETTVGDHELARQAINLLEDRRILFEDIAWEIPSECIHSAERARHDLTAIINSPGISDALATELKLIRSYFRTFMTDAREADIRGHRWHGTDPFSAALGELRVKVGQVVGDLASRFDLPVEPDLARIVRGRRGRILRAGLAVADGRRERLSLGRPSACRGGDRRSRRVTVCRVWWRRAPDGKSNIGGKWSLRCTPGTQDFR